MGKPPVLSLLPLLLIRGQVQCSANTAHSMSSPEAHILYHMADNVHASSFFCLLFQLYTHKLPACGGLDKETTVHLNVWCIGVCA